MRHFSTTENWPEEYNSLLEDLRTYQNQLVLSTTLAKSIEDIALDNVKYVSETYPWYFRSDEASLTKITNLMAYDSLMYNRAVYYSLVALSNFGVYNSQNQLLEGQLLLNIAALRSPQSGRAQLETLQNAGWTPLESYDCADVSSTDFTTNLVLPGFVVNTSSDKLYMRIAGHPESTLAIAPGQSEPLLSTLGSVVELLEASGACRKQFTFQGRGLVELN